MARPKKGETDDKKLQFGIWLGIPACARKEDEQTQEQLAKKLDISHFRLCAWKREPEVQHVAHNALKILGGIHRWDIFNALIKSAKGDGPRSWQDRKTFLEWQGDIGTKQPPNLPKEISVRIVTDDRENNKGLGDKGIPATD